MARRPIEDLLDRWAGGMNRRDSVRTNSWLVAAGTAGLDPRGAAARHRHCWVRSPDGAERSGFLFEWRGTAQPERPGGVRSSSLQDPSRRERAYAVNLSVSATACGEESPSGRHRTTCRESASTSKIDQRSVIEDLLSGNHLENKGTHRQIAGWNVKGWCGPLIPWQDIRHAPILGHACGRWAFDAMFVGRGFRHSEMSGLPITSPPHRCCCRPRVACTPALGG